MNVHLRRIPRYTMVAIFCALLHNVILIGMDALGANVFWCQTASAAVLLPVGFWLQSHVTFRSERSWGGFLRYSGALITNFPVALGVLWFTRDLLALPMWAAAPFSSAALFCWNYLTSSWALSRGASVAEPARG
jgi:putative flippase GtrA